MSGARRTLEEVAEVKATSMKVSKKEEDPILAAEAEKAAKEKRKAELQAELEAEELEVAEIEKRIAEKRAEKAEAEKKEKETAAQNAADEERMFLDFARESRAKREKLEQELGAKQETKPAYDSAVDRVREALNLAGVSAEELMGSVTFENGSTINLKPGGAEQKGFNPDSFLTEMLEEESPGFWGRLKALKTLSGWVWLGKKLVKTLLPSSQLIVLFGFIFLSWYCFNLYGAKIDSHNAALQTEAEINAKWINPYNYANIQRMFFEALNIGLKVALGFVILFIISPQTVRYILPFWNKQNNIVSDFNEAEGWVRLFFLLGLLFIVLEFLGKTSVLNTI